MKNYINIGDGIRVYTRGKCYESFPCKHDVILANGREALMNSVNIMSLIEKNSVKVSRKHRKFIDHLKKSRDGYVHRKSLAT